MPGYTFNGLGSSFASIPDVDGDGVPEIVMGAPYYNGHGAVFVLYTDRTWSGVTSLIDTSDITILGSEYQDYIGTTVAGGDLDGDGHGDIMVGMPSGLLDDVDGSVLVYRGPFTTPTVLTVDDDAAPPDLTVLGEDGAYVSAVAFLPRTQGGDLAVGAPYYVNSDGEEAGAVGVVYGTAGQ